MAKLSKSRSGRHTVVARLNEEAAPQSVARSGRAATRRDRSSRPLERHGQLRSRRSTAGPLDSARIASPSTTGNDHLRPEHGEIAFSYGQARRRRHRHHWATHLATVEGNTAPYLAAIAQTSAVAPSRSRSRSGRLTAMPARRIRLEVDGVAAVAELSMTLATMARHSGSHCRSTPDEPRHVERLGLLLLSGRKAR